MKKIILIIIYISSFVFTEKGWIKTYGSDEKDFANSIIETNDGGKLLIGYTNSFGNGGGDIWLVKTNSNGGEEWNRFYGGSQLDVGIKGIQNKNSITILSNTYSTNKKTCNIMLLTINLIGEVLWEKTYGDTNNDIAKNFIQLDNGNYLITGKTEISANNHDALIIQTDSLGNILWDVNHGGTKNEIANSIIQTNDNNFIFIGNTFSYDLDRTPKKRGLISNFFRLFKKEKPNEEIWLVKINKKGKKIWHRTFGGKKSEQGQNIFHDKSNGYILVGSSETYGKGKKNIWIIGTDLEGRKKWESTKSNKSGLTPTSSLQLLNKSIIILTKHDQKKVDEYIIYNFNDKGQFVSKFNINDKNLIIDANDIIKSNNIYFLSGRKITDINGEGDAWIARINEKGLLNWDYAYGGRGADGANSIIELRDSSNYLMTGYTDAYGNGKRDVWLIKLDKDGEKIWSNVYGGKKDDIGVKTIETFNGDLVTVGSTDSFGSGNSDIYIVKTDSLGRHDWSKTFGGLGEDNGVDIIDTKDSNKVILGNTNSYGKGSSDIWIMKLDNQGDTIWDTKYGGSGFDIANSMLMTSDTCYIIAGQTSSFSDGSLDAWIIKFNKDGKLMWQNTFGGNGTEGFRGIYQTDNQDLIMVGEYSSYFSKGSKDSYIVRTDRNGNKKWETFLGGKKADQAVSVSGSDEYGFILIGETASSGSGKNDIQFLAIDGNGKELWRRTFGGSGVDIGTSILETNKGRFIATGISTISTLSYDAIIISTDNQGKSKPYEKNK